MDKEKIQQLLNSISRKLKPVFEAVKSFVVTHKVLTTVVCVVFALVLSVTVFVLDKLNRFNYDDGSNPSVVYTEASGITTGVTTQNSNSKFTSFKAADGSTVFADGSYINAAGAGILTDGTTIYPTGIVVFQDGTYILGSGIRVSSDGIATFSDGSQLHLTLFSIRKDGRILSKSPDGSISIINNVAEHAVINSAQGAVQFGSTAPSTTNPLQQIGNNSGNTNSAPITSPVQNVEEEEIDDHCQC